MKKYFDIYLSNSGIPFLRQLKDFPKRINVKRAIELSIEKWEVIAEWHKKNPGSNKQVNHIGALNCCLCRKYNTGIFYCLKQDISCLKCPVYIKTGRQYCEDTPYEIYTADGLWPNEKSYLVLAQDEVNFLKSLL